MIGKIMIDRESLESIVEQQIRQALIERFEGMVGTIMSWHHDNPINGLDLDPDVFNKAVIANNELIIKMLSNEIEKLKN